MIESSQEIASTLEMKHHKVGNLTINDFGVVVDGHIIILDYKHKEYNIKIKCANFGTHYGYGYNYNDVKNYSGGCSGITEKYNRHHCISEIEVLDAVIGEFKKDMPEKHYIEINHIINKKRNEQLTLF